MKNNIKEQFADDVISFLKEKNIEDKDLNKILSCAYNKAKTKNKK